MKSVKSFFETPQKIFISSACIIAELAVIGTGTVFAASTIAEGSAIGSENAQNFAFADAGVDPASVDLIRTEFDFEQGQFVYEVEFYANGSEYEYWIKSSDGAIVKKEVELLDSAAAAVATVETLQLTAEAVVEQITVEEAKKIALDDAGVEESEVTFTKSKLDKDDGITVYDIEFYVDNTEYEYEINAQTGAIYSKSKEIHTVAEPEEPAQSSTQNTQKTTTATVQPTENTVSTTSSRISLETAKANALADAGLSSSDVTFTKEKLDYDDGIEVYDIEFYTASHEYDYEINATTGAIHSKEVEAHAQASASVSSGTTSQSSGTYIGVDEAKSIAVSHAGLSVSDVTFKKAKLDDDDGRVEYEIEFYYGNMEYEYDIDAVSGSILDFDMEYDDD